MTKKHASWYFMCRLSFKSHNFGTESLFKCVAFSYRGSTTLCCFVCLQCLTLRTFWIQNPAHTKQCILGRLKFSVPDHPIGRMCGIGTSKFFFWNQEIFALRKPLSHYSSGWIPTSPTKSSFKKLVLNTRLWQYANMKTTLKAPEG